MWAIFWKCSFSHISTMQRFLVFLFYRSVVLESTLQWCNKIPATRRTSEKRCIFQKKIIFVTLKKNLKIDFFRSEMKSKKSVWCPTMSLFGQLTPLLLRLYTLKGLNTLFLLLNLWFLTVISHSEISLFHVEKKLLILIISLQWRKCWSFYFTGI